MFSPSVRPAFLNTKGYRNHLNYIFEKLSFGIRDMSGSYTDFEDSIKNLKPNLLKNINKETFFKNAKVKVKDDVYGASIAACYDKKGIVGILGSGANCAYYDGKKPEKNNYGLGFILGDEGSSNHLGRLLLKNYLD